MSDTEETGRDARQPESYAYRDAGGSGWSRVARSLGRVVRAVTRRGRR